MLRRCGLLRAQDPLRQYLVGLSTGRYVFLNRIVVHNGSFIGTDHDILLDAIVIVDILLSARRHDEVARARFIDLVLMFFQHTSTLYIDKLG